MNIFHVDHENKVLAFQRWQEDQADSSVVVIANFGSRNMEGYTVGFPAAGEWSTRFNSNSQLYDDNFDDMGIAQVMAEEQGADGLPAMASVNLPAYALLILTR